MIVSQTLTILSGIFALALASAQSAESCSGEACTDELSAWSSLLQTTVARQWKGEHKNNESVYESEATVQDKRALDANYILREHNIARCMHGADPLVWDDTLASHGKSWADTIHYSGMKHGDTEFNGIRVGQNLAGSCSSPSYPASDETAVSSWMEEESYNGGHYTQVVWKGSEQLGCGMWCGPDQGMNCCMVACNYYPAGNNGEDGSNVEARVKSRSQCESEIGDGGDTPPSPAPPPAPVPAPDDEADNDYPSPSPPSGECNDPNNYVGDKYCDADLNTEECNWDGGDCEGAAPAPVPAPVPSGGSCSFSGCDGCGDFCSGSNGHSCSSSSNGGNDCRCDDGTSCGGS